MSIYGVPLLHFGFIKRNSCYCQYNLILFYRFVRFQLSFLTVFFISQYSCILYVSFIDLCKKIDMYTAFSVMLSNQCPLQFVDKILYRTNSNPNINTLSNLTNITNQTNKIDPNGTKP